ncbi:MAG: glucuronate isomerase [Planctomycetota bacterium]
MTFIQDDFLLQTEAARRLYHGYAADEPILDYHTHLPPADIAADRRFGDLFEAWLEGDHYKWRAMRTAGVPERLCTGDAAPKEKFLAWARTVPQTLGNPLYHWTHLELKRYFGFDGLLSEASAEEVWEQANATLASDGMTCRGMMERFGVRAVCSTDDPADDLADHEAIAASDCATKVYPTFRPDAALRVDEPEEWRSWLGRLGERAGQEIRTIDGLLGALKHRHDAFHGAGCRLSDHGVEQCFASPCTEQEAAAIFQTALAGTPATPDEHRRFGTYLMLEFGRWDAERGWTKQLHIGPLRNNNLRLYRSLGRDIGCDSIGDRPQAETLSWYLGQLDLEGRLPKTVLYNINPAHNHVFASMAGNFQDGETPGKVQWGSGWWFLDQWDGMTEQMRTLANLGLLSRFVGMLTDSRSFLSFPRHEYFRRCLCDFLGAEMERGALPADDALVGQMVRGICYSNAREYLGLAVD